LGSISPFSHLSIELKIAALIASEALSPIVFSSFASRGKDIMIFSHSSNRFLISNKEILGFEAFSLISCSLVLVSDINIILGGHDFLSPSLCLFFIVFFLFYLV